MLYLEYSIRRATTLLAVPRRSFGVSALQCCGSQSAVSSVALSSQWFAAALDARQPGLVEASTSWGVARCAPTAGSPCCPYIGPGLARPWPIKASRRAPEPPAAAKAMAQRAPVQQTPMDRAHG